MTKTHTRSLTGIVLVLAVTGCQSLPGTPVRVPGQLSPSNHPTGFQPSATQQNTVQDQVASGSPAQIPGNTSPVKADPTVLISSGNDSKQMIRQGPDGQTIQPGPTGQVIEQGPNPATNLSGFLEHLHRDLGMPKSPARTETSQPAIEKRSGNSNQSTVVRQSGGVGQSSVIQQSSGSDSPSSSVVQQSPSGGQSGSQSSQQMALP